MIVQNVVRCRPEALHYFQQHLPVLGTTRGLLHAALGVSLHALDDARPDMIEHGLAELVERVRCRCVTDHKPAILAHLHHVLFAEERFRSPAAMRTLNPLYSYLPAVMLIKEGAPSMLALIYKVVGESLGLQIEGLLAPGHFLVRVHDGAGWLLVDPSQGGRVLTGPEASQLIDAKLEEAATAHAWQLAPADHSLWLDRILSNLVQLFAEMERADDHRAMHELLEHLRLGKSEVGLPVHFAG